MAILAINTAKLIILARYENSQKN